MKKLIKILSLVVMLFVFSKGLYAQSSDFWLSFGTNGYHSANELKLEVRIVASINPATVKFIYTESGIIDTVTVPAGNVRTFSISNTQKSSVYSNITGKSNKSLHIESDVPVSVYALNNGGFSTDATNVLSVTELGAEYYHISYRSLHSVIDYEGYTLVATENNTDIYENDTWIANIDRGQVYSSYFLNTDSTGMYIRATKPVAYFVTHPFVNIPTDAGFADCLYQQLFPVNKWGNNFLVPVTHRGAERIRIVASQDGTVITQTGGIIKTDNGGYGQNSLNLKKGQFVELETTLNSCGCFIKSNKPVGVCSYLMGWSNTILTDKKGDPAMAWIPPIEQSILGVLIAPFVPHGITDLDSHYALIITPTAYKDQTTVTAGTNFATSLTGGSWCDNIDSKHSFYLFPLNNIADEPYYFANPYGLTVMCYGIGSAESYYYLAYSAVRDFAAAFYVNNIHYHDLNNDLFCDTLVNFRARVQNAQVPVPGFLRWYIDGLEQTSKTDNMEWSKALSIGKHTVTINVVSIDNDTIKLSAAFNVGIAYYDTVTATICLGEHYQDEYKFDTVPKQAGFIQYSQYRTTKAGCDSIITLQLTVNSTLITIDTTICQNETYNAHGFTVKPTDSGFFSYERIDTTSDNCYITNVLNLTVNPAYNKSIFATIDEGEFYQVGNYQYNTTGIYTVNLKTATNCDSIINLNLSVIHYPEITAFSPFNKDGINDYFMAGYRVQIFNRYGTLIYETNTSEEQRIGWDGRNSKGQYVEPGMYFYILYNSSGQAKVKSSVEVLKK